MIQGDFDGFIFLESIGFSHYQFRFVIQDVKEPVQARFGSIPSNVQQSFDPFVELVYQSQVLIFEFLFDLELVGAATVGFFEAWLGCSMGFRGKFMV